VNRLRAGADARSLGVGADSQRGKLGRGVWWKIRRESAQLRERILRPTPSRKLIQHPLLIREHSRDSRFSRHAFLCALAPLPEPSLSQEDLQIFLANLRTPLFRMRNKVDTHVHVMPSGSFLDNSRNHAAAVSEEFHVRPVASRPNDWLCDGQEHDGIRTGGDIIRDKMLRRDARTQVQSCQRDPSRVRDASREEGELCRQKRVFAT
jgi:hypothetical protein